jgi:hypothetical protein
MTTSRIPEPADPFEEDGLPATDSWLPQKEITGDAQEGFAAPAERETYGNTYGVTASEQQRGETIDAYLAAEEPDVLSGLDEPADDSDDAAQPFPVDRDERVGRIVDVDEGAREDDEPSAIAYDAGTDEGGFSAEERAMHIERG